MNRVGTVLGGFSALDWLIAWRHLRSGDDRPAWVRPLLLTAVYLILIGGGMAYYASTLSSSPPPVIDGPFGPIEPTVTATPLEQWFGVFGGFTLIIGVMALTFALLARFFSLLPTVITMSVLLGCMALVIVLSLMSGLEGDLRDKILNQKAHIRVSREDGKPFSDYGALADALARGEGIAGASPYLEGEIMVRSGLNRQGAVLSGIVPSRQTDVSNLPEIIEQGDYTYLENPEAIPENDPFSLEGPGTPYRLRHLEDERKKNAKVDRVSDDERTENDVGFGAAGLGPTGAKDGVDAAPKNKLPKRPALPGLEDLDVPAEGDDGGWEDPQDELEAIKAPPAKPASASDQARSALLGDIPSVQERLAAPPQPPEDDGWEDPTAELGLEADVQDGWEDGWEDPSPGANGGGAEQGGPVEPLVEEGPSFEVSGPGNPILIGRELSMELGVRLGASVQLITPIGRITPAGQVPGQLAAKIG
ncbi:MAG: hypothetical protein AAGA54_16845, partial [Myxococcota bacterium]